MQASEKNEKNRRPKKGEIWIRRESVADYILKGFPERVKGQEVKIKRYDDFANRVEYSSSSMLSLTEFTSMFSPSKHVDIESIRDWIKE